MARRKPKKLQPMDEDREIRLVDIRQIFESARDKAVKAVNSPEVYNNPGKIREIIFGAWDETINKLFKMTKIEELRLWDSFTKQQKYVYMQAHFPQLDFRRFEKAVLGEVAIAIWNETRESPKRYQA